MGGMTGLSIGVSGLKSSQNAINTTAHNLANANTKGYVRQQITFSDTSYVNLGVGGVYTNQSGLGVSVQEVRRVRDALLDKAYRQEVGRQSFYEKQFLAIDEIQELFGEFNNVTFANYMENFRSAMQEVAKEPQGMTQRSAMIQSAANFIDQAVTIYKGLQDYQDLLNEQVGNMVNRINQLGDTIYELNQKISSIEGAGIESANDYRDQRDNALDELGSLINIQYEEDTNGVVTVKAEGVEFISGLGVKHMGAEALHTAEDSGLLSPVWPHLRDKEVFNLNVTISTSKENDLGALKSVLLARGDKIADYTDIPNADDYVGGVNSPAYKRAQAAGLNPVASDYEHGKASTAYKADLEVYNKGLSQSTVRTVMAELDQLVNKMVTTFNDILCPNKELETSISGKDANGNTVTIPAGSLILDTENAGYGYSEHSDVQGVELFCRKDVERYTKITGDDGKTYYVYNEKNEFGSESLYTLNNLKINEELLHDDTLLPLSNSEGGEFRARAEALVEAWSTASLKLTPTHNNQKSFMDYYTELTDQIASAGSLYENMIAHQESVTNGIDGGRQAISGVSSDEELTNLIKFQAAYNAASRYITVVDQMMEHLVTRL